MEVGDLSDSAVGEIVVEIEIEGRDRVDLLYEGSGDSQHG